MLYDNFAMLTKRELLIRIVESGLRLLKTYGPKMPDSRFGLTMINF